MLNLDEILEASGDLVSGILEYEFRSARDVLSDVFELVMRPFARVGKATDDALAAVARSTEGAREFVANTLQDIVATTIAFALSSQRSADEEELTARMFMPIRFPDKRFGPLYDHLEES